MASLATILTHYYDTPVGEEELLQELPALSRAPDGARTAVDAGVSFEDLARLARGRGYRALGVSLGFADLLRLRRPAIVALDLGERQHFSVLRRADSRSVSLADPSWGNRSMPRQAFVERFLRDAGGTRGRALLILTQDAAAGRASFMQSQRLRVQLTPGLLGAARPPWAAPAGAAARGSGPQ